VELIAHRAANRPADVRAGLAAADAVELDVHLRRGRLEVRHAKVLWPTSILWEQWYIARDERSEPLAPIMDVAGHDAHLWFDLKGFTPRLTAEVLTAATGRPLSTMSCRSWWLLRAARGRNGVRTVRSIGARWQLWWATRRSTPTVDGHGLADRYATPATVAALRRRNPFVAVWGVTEGERIEVLAAMGVGAVIADDLTLLASARRALTRTLSESEPPCADDHDP
jgi:glycerophosphoryl diester phosphodiesterase